MIRLFPKKLRRKIQQHRPVVWTVNATAILLVLFVLFAVMHKFAEGSSWEVAFWMSWETFSTVGYGDHPAATAWGRSGTMILGSINILVMSAFIGIVVALVEYLSARRRTGFMNNPYKDGYVLIHFPGTQQTATFIREIRENEPDVGICIVDNNIEELPLDIQDKKKIHFVRGTMFDPKVHDKAGLKKNKGIIVFSQDPGNGESDGITKVVVDLALKHVDGQAKVMYLLTDERNGYMFEDLPAVRVLSDLEIFSVVQECQDSDSAPLVERMLRNTEGAALNTVTPVGIVGWSWGRFASGCLSITENRANPLALIRDGEIQLCPLPDITIEEGDTLSIMAFNGFDWEAFERKLLGNAIKKMVSKLDLD